MSGPPLDRAARVVAHRLAPLAALAWWASWRMPWWRAWTDFFDSPQFVDRVAHSAGWGFQSPTAHLPLQSLVLGPSGILQELRGEGAAPESSITAVATLYGLFAFMAAVACWKRLLPPRVLLGSVLLYPLLLGPALADLSTYSMSAVHAFLWGATWAWLRAGDQETPRRALPWHLLAALLAGLAVHTHVLALIWMTVPAAAWWRLLSARDDVAFRVRTLAWGIGLPLLLSVVGFLLLEGWQASLVGLADDAWHGFFLILLRDSGGERWWQAELRHVAVVTGGFGALCLPVGAVLLWRGQGSWVAVALAGTLVSTLVSGYQFHWGFQGRLWLPMLLWGVPCMVSVVLVPWRRAGTAAFVVLLAWSTVSFVHVFSSRRAGPHPPVNERELSRAWVSSQDLHVMARRAAGYTHVVGPRAFSFEHEEDRPLLDRALNTAFKNGGRVWISSQAIKQPYQLRDGHFIAVDHSAAPREPTRLEKHLHGRGMAVVLSMPTGRGEFVAEAMPADRAPPLRERMQRAFSSLTETEALWLVVDAPADKPAFHRLLSTDMLDCVLRDTYDAWDLEAFYALIRTGCRPVATGSTDATGILLKPVPSRGGYTHGQGGMLVSFQRMTREDVLHKLETLSRGMAILRAVPGSNHVDVSLLPVP